MATVVAVFVGWVVGDGCGSDTVAAVTADWGLVAGVVINVSAAELAEPQPDSAVITSKLAVMMIYFFAFNVRI